MSETQIIQNDAPEPTEAPEANEYLEESPDGESPEGDGGESDEVEGEGKKAPQTYKRELEKIRREAESYKSAMAKERRQRQEEQRRNQQIMERVQRIERSWEEQARAREQQEEPPVPDAEQDPIAALKWMQQELDAYKRREAEQMRQHMEFQQRAAQIGQIKTRLDNEDAEFTRQAPDYPEAIQHLAQMKVQEYMAYGASQDEAIRRLQADIIEMSNQAWARGRSPAEAAYSIARSMGFRPAAERNRMSPLQSVRAGQSAAKTIAGGGRSPKGPLSFEDIAKIKDDAAFDRAFDEWEKSMTRR